MEFNIKAAPLWIFIIDIDLYNKDPQFYNSFNIHYIEKQNKIEIYCNDEDMLLLKYKTLKIMDEIALAEGSLKRTLNEELYKEMFYKGKEED